tara:strand:+ start:1203 stop:1823 length:621 start_codon:yes stop_codon:yes gene_type:complete
MPGRYNAGGVDVYPVGSTLLRDQLIYQPANGGGDLGGQAFIDDVRPNFAGGLLNEGAQYNPVTNRFQPITPSGVFTADPGSAARFGEGPEEMPGDGAFTLADLMEFEAAMRQGNFGNQDSASVFSSFEDRGKGTYNVASNSGTGPYTNLFYGTTATGDYVPMNEAEYKLGGRKGEVIDPQLVRETIKGRLRLIDESGGDGDTAGDD